MIRNPAIFCSYSMLIALLTKQGSSNATSARSVPAVFTSVQQKRSPSHDIVPKLTFARKCRADFIADGSTLSSHWAEQKHLVPEELSCVCCQCSSEGPSSPCLLPKQNCVPWSPLCADVSGCVLRLFPAPLCCRVRCLATTG